LIGFGQKENGWSCGLSKERRFEMCPWVISWVDPGINVVDDVRSRERLLEDAVKDAVRKMGVPVGGHLVVYHHQDVESPVARYTVVRAGRFPKVRLINPNQQH
jgi:hypothetical protein